MFRSAVLLVTAFVLTFCAHSQQTARLLDSAVNLYFQQKKFNGSVLVAQKGKILLQQGYGYKDVAAKTKADANSLYQYGSVTKQFTAALVMYLQEKGKLNIRDKLSKYFPELPFADSVTIYNLLTHTSGIYNYTRNIDFMMHDAVKPITQEKMLALFRDHPLEFKPGTQFSYSNSGYILLGYIIEKASGMPYEKLMRQVVLQPLGLRTAGFDFAHNQSADRTTGYNFIDGDKGDKAGIVDSSVSYAAGALFGSVKDLYTWHQALEKGALLGAASWKQIYTPFLSKYGFGWDIDSLFGRQVIQHNGGIFGYTSVIKRFPQDDVVVIVLANNSSPKIEEMANNLAAIVFGQPVNWPKEKTAIQLPEEKLKPYVGEYELMPNFTVVIRLENGVLKVKPSGQNEADLLPMSETDFFVKNEDVDISFQKDDTGAVKGFQLKQGGGVMQAKKTK
jgi:CubicO group peptidase (beta-lactamase class C family)